ncbi:MAG TPA: efflux RND transporter periplasmic adaptor subunit [Candidatus Acidoferrales bacterium]|nr:efflux RND transporter periplasmic adaptor subunit [Candidatus Acidoferrales bacterium]
MEFFRTLPPACRATAALAGLLFALSACGSRQQAAPASNSIAPSSTDVTIPTGSRGIETTAARSQPIVVTIAAPGRIVPDPARVIRVFPPAGGRIITVTVHPGDLVRKGQVLATLESSDAAGALSDYQKAQADLNLKQKALQRSQDLKDHGALSERDLQQAQADFSMAQATLAAASSRLQYLGVNPNAPLKQLDVFAPRAGAILDTGAAPGELSKALDAAQPLCTIADLSEVWAEGELYEKDINAIHVGDEAVVELAAFPGKQWKARVANIGYALDPVARTLKLRVVLPNPALKLKPDMFATIRLTAVNRTGLVVPASALLTSGQQSYLYVRKSPDTFARRLVTVRPVDGSLVEITSGLAPGELVVTQGALMLRDAGS